MIAKVIKMVKLKLALREEDASPETLEELEKIISDKIGMVVE